MAITDKERGEIAARLRGAKGDSSCFYPLVLRMMIWPQSTTFVDTRQLLNRLADLIEPEPERTCKIVSEHYYDDYDQYETELPCGHNFETHDKPELFVRFCPECGAKVMRNE